MIDHIDTTTLISIIIATLGVAYSIRTVILKVRINNALERKIAESEMEKNIEKFIRIRNSNSKIKRRMLSDKEIKNVIQTLENLLKELDEVKRKSFVSDWEMKTQKDKLNYLAKLIQESNENSEFKKIEPIK